MAEEGITRDQLKAFRNADSAVFSWERIEGGTAGTIRLGKEINRSDGFGRDTLHVDILARARVQNYGAGMGDGNPNHRLDPAVSGCWVRLSLSVDPVWGTFARFLKVGDVIVQEWTVDNRNSLLKDAGLTMHELKACVIRGDKRYAFMLDASVLSPFNSADCVRRAAR